MREGGWGGGWGEGWGEGVGSGGVGALSGQGGGREARVSRLRVSRLGVSRLGVRGDENEVGPFLVFFHFWCQKIKLGQNGQNKNGNIFGVENIFWSKKWWNNFWCLNIIQQCPSFEQNSMENMYIAHVIQQVNLWRVEWGGVRVGYGRCGFESVRGPTVWLFFFGPPPSPWLAFGHHSRPGSHLAPTLALARIWPPCSPRLGICSLLAPARN